MIYILISQTLKYFKHSAKGNYIDIDIGEHSHLAWKQYENNKRIPTLGNNLRYLYLFGLIAPIFLVKDVTLKTPLVLYAIGSAIYSAKKYRTDEFTSMWCYISIGFMIILCSNKIL